MTRLNRSFLTAIAFTAMTPACLMAAPAKHASADRASLTNLADEGSSYRLYVRVERVSPGKAAEDTLNASLMSPVSKMLNASIMNSRSYVKDISRNNNGNLVTKFGEMKTGFNINYIIRPYANGHLEVPVALSFSEPFAANFTGNGYKPIGGMQGYCFDKLRCIQLLSYKQVHLDETLDMIPGRDLVVEDKNSQGFQFVFHLEPVSSI